MKKLDQHNLVDSGHVFQQLLGVLVPASAHLNLAFMPDRWRQTIHMRDLVKYCDLNDLKQYN